MMLNTVTQFIVVLIEYFVALFVAVLLSPLMACSWVIRFHRDPKAGGRDMWIAELIMDIARFVMKDDFNGQIKQIHAEISLIRQLINNNHAGDSPAIN